MTQRKARSHAGNYYVSRRLRPDNGAIADAILATHALVEMELIDSLAWLVLAFRGGPIRSPRTSTVPGGEASLIEHLELAYYRSRTALPQPNLPATRQIDDAEIVDRVVGFVREHWETNGTGPLWSEVSTFMQWPRYTGAQIIRALIKRRVLLATSQTRSLRVGDGRVRPGVRA